MIAGLFEAIPLVGPLIGAAPAVLVGLLVSPGTAVLVALLYVAIQVVENNLLVPRIMSSNVGLNPLVVMIAIVAGASLGGAVGALLAIPVAGVIKGIAQHVWTPTPAAPAEETSAPVGRKETTMVALSRPEALCRCIQPGLIRSHKPSMGRQSCSHSMRLSARSSSERRLS